MNSAQSIIPYHEELTSGHEAGEAYAAALQDILDERISTFADKVENGHSAGRAELANLEDFTREGPDNRPERKDIKAFVNRELGEEPSLGEIYQLADDMEELRNTGSLDVELLALEIKDYLSRRASGLQKPTAIAPGTQIDSSFGKRHKFAGDDNLSRKPLYNRN